MMLKKPDFCSDPCMQTVLLEAALSNCNNAADKASSGQTFLAISPEAQNFVIYVFSEHANIVLISAVILGLSLDC